MPEDESHALPPEDVDDDLADAVAGVIADELRVQLLMRRESREIADLVADELVRAFEIRPWGALSEDSVPDDDWPVVRHVTVDRADQAHLELAKFRRLPSADVLTLELPAGGRLAVHLAEDGSVAEILLSPASRLLPPDVRQERPQPTSAADAE